MIYDQFFVEYCSQLMLEKQNILIISFDFGEQSFLVEVTICLLFEC